MIRLLNGVCAPTSASSTGQQNTVKTVEASPSPATDEKASVEVFNSSRRRLIWACIWGYLGVNFLMFLRYFFPRVLFEPNPIVNIGYRSDFHLGVNQKFLASDRIWVVKEPTRLFVIFARCTHLGCTPDWFPGSDEFHCPCHGSEYDSEGINFAGPAPRPMDRCHVELDPNDHIIIDTSRLYMDDPRAGVNHFNVPGAYIPI